MRKRLVCSLLMMIGPAGCVAQDAAPAPTHGAYTAAPEGSERCQGARWCWEEGAPIAALHGVADDAVYAATAAGSVLAWTGEGWRADLLSTVSMSDVWVAARDDVYAVDGVGAAWHFDGSRWSTLPVKGKRIHGSTPRNVWIGHNQFDGERWHERAAGPTTQVSQLVAVGVNQAYAIVWSPRTGHVFMHFDGTAWREVSPAPAGELGTLELVRGEVRVRSAATLHRFDGVAWRSEPLPYPRVGARDNPRAPFPLHDGYDYRTMPVGSPCRVARRIDDDTAFCFGDHGVIQRFDGTRWVDTVSPPFARTRGAEDWGRLPPALWAGGGARVAWGSGPDDVWRVRRDPARAAAARAVIEHYDGARWEERASGESYVEVTGAGPRDVWFVGTPLLHWDGARIEAVALPEGLSSTALRGGHAVRGGVAFFVGGVDERDGKSYLLRRLAGRWEVLKQSAPDESFDDVVARDASTAWVLGVGFGVADGRWPEQNVARLHALGDGRWTESEPSNVLTTHQLALRGDTLWATTRYPVLQVSTTTGASSLLPSIPALARSEYDNPGNAIFWTEQAELWVGDDALWLYTERQAVRYALPQGGSM